jgi:excisionase family DNA binding protein
LDKFLTVKEAFEPLGYSDEQGLYRDIREGNFTAFVRIGSKIRIPLSALNQWVEDQLKINQDKAKARADAA